MSKLPKLSTVKKKADDLLTPIVKKENPLCLLNSPGCTKLTQVAHHHVHKSKSTALRYVMENLIPLCGHCHVVLHHNESFWASKIIQKKGIEWFNRLELIKNRTTVKADVHYFIGHYERLKQKLSEI